MRVTGRSRKPYDAPAGDGGDTLASKENDLSHSLRLNSLLAFAVSVAALAAGCGDTSRATGAPPPPAVRIEPVIEQDVPISSEWVGTLVGYIQCPDPRPRQRAPREPELQGGLARQDRRPSVPGRSATRSRPPSIKPTPGCALRKSQVSQANAQCERESGTGRASQGHRSSRTRPRSSGRRPPSVNGARCRPLYAARAARVGEPAGARQRRAEQSRESRRGGRRARRGAETLRPA